MQVVHLLQNTKIKLIRVQCKRYHMWGYMRLWF